MCTTSGLNGVGASTFTRQVSPACALPPGRSTTVARGCFIQVRWVAIGTPPLLKNANPG